MQSKSFKAVRRPSGLDLDSFHWLSGLFPFDDRTTPMVSTQNLQTITYLLTGWPKKGKLFEWSIWVLTYVVCISSGDLLICRIFNFQLLKINLKQRKREFHWSTFFVWPIRNFLSQLKEKENKYIFILQNSKILQISKPPDEIHTTLKSI